MAEILYYKDNIEKTVYKICCDNCGAVAEYAENEIRGIYQYNEHCGDYVECPNCKKHITIDKKKTEKYIKKFPYPNKKIQ